MKKMTLIVSALVCGLILAGCGGSGSKIKKNDYLGNLPALYEGYNAERAEMEKKLEEESNKLIAGGEKNYSKIQKLFDDQEAKEKTLKEKFNADIKAELAKIEGKEIPVSYSQKLVNSDEQFYNVSGVKLLVDKDKLSISFVLSAKEDLEVPRYKGLDYSAYFRLYATDSSTLTKSVFLPIKADTKPLQFTEGQILVETSFPIHLSNNPEPYAGFAGVEFISNEEYKALSK